MVVEGLICELHQELVISQGDQCNWCAWISQCSWWETLILSIVLFFHHCRLACRRVICSLLQWLLLRKPSVTSILLFNSKSIIVHWKVRIEFLQPDRKQKDLYVRDEMFKLFYQIHCRQSLLVFSYNWHLPSSTKKMVVFPGILKHSSKAGIQWKPLMVTALSHWYATQTLIILCFWEEMHSMIPTWLGPR